MKLYHYILIAVAVLVTWYITKKHLSKKEDDKKEPQDKPQEDTPQEDTSENADVATITLEQALAIAEKNYEDFQLSYDNGDSREYKYTLGYTDEDNEWHYESISKQTFETLVEKGYEADYN